MGAKTRGAIAALLLICGALPASAGALSLGEVAPSAPPLCPGGEKGVFFIQSTSGPSSYAVPAGGGLITSWSTSFGKSGGTETMVLARPTAIPSEFTIVGADTETLPTPIAANHISSFTLASPFLVQAGDKIGLEVPPGSEEPCAFVGLPGDVTYAGYPSGYLAGGTLAAIAAPTEVLVDAEVQLVQSTDLSLTEAVSPATGGPGVALFSLTPGGPGPGGIGATVTDTLPSGLTILGAGVTNGGSCSVAGQNVTCNLSSVTLGSGAPVIDIAVSSTAPGTYVNQALITPGSLSDTNLANNSASATLTVSAPVAPAKCTVIAFKGATLSLTETALKALHCKVGKVKKVASKTVRKGLVVSTSLKAGATAAADTSVAINVSSGKPKKGHH